MLLIGKKYELITQFYEEEFLRSYLFVDTLSSVGNLILLFTLSKMRNQKNTHISKIGERNLGTF